MNVFGIALTNEAPSSNNRGENQENYLPLQHITIGDKIHSVVTSVSIRNRLRDVLALNFIMNRSRHQLPDNPQPCVKYSGLINPNKFLDDAIFGYVVAEKKKSESKSKASKEEDNAPRLREPDAPIIKKSLLLVNHAVSLYETPHDTLLQQYPRQERDWVESKKSKSAKKKADTENEDEGTPQAHGAVEGGLLTVEVHYTSYQFPFGLERVETWNNDDWIKGVLNAIGQLGQVAGNHSRTFFDFSPKSLVVRITDAPAPQFNLYGFQKDGTCPSILDAIRSSKKEEFWVTEDVLAGVDREALKGIHIEANPAKLLVAVGEFVCKK